MTRPKFKVYDSRKANTYKGKFAFSSENEGFELNNITINGKSQVCLMDNQQVWPIEPQADETIDDSSCGIIKPTTFANTFSLPSVPGQFPWVVAIYRFFNDDEESFYKCSGTIIDKGTVLTSVNCLLEDGNLLNPSDVQVYVAPYLLSKVPKSRIFQVEKFHPHESFNFYLENNIAIMKLSKDIQFNDFIKPICLPTSENYDPKGKIGKVKIYL